MRALIHYDLLAISRVLPTVPRIRLSCILCTWFPLRRSEDTPVEHPGREPGSTGQGGKRQMSEIRSRRSEIGRQRAEDEIAGFCEVKMPGNIIHVMAMGEQIIDITKIGISDNF